MAHELTPIDIADLTSVQDLSRVVDEVARTHQPRMIRRADKDVAVLSPVAPPVKKRRARGRVLTANDPLFDLIGIGHSNGPGDVSANKHRYLVAAYHAKRHRDPVP